MPVSSSLPNSLRGNYMVQDSKILAALLQWISWSRGKNSSKSCMNLEATGYITISNVGAKNSEIFVCDSLYSSYSSNVQQQIACLLKAERPNIELHFVDVHMRKWLWSLCYRLRNSPLPGKTAWKIRIWPDGNETTLTQMPWNATFHNVPSSQRA